MQNDHILRDFVDEVSRDSIAKLFQIGIEPSVLGIPKENGTFENAGSFFRDWPFDLKDEIKFPKAWLEFDSLPHPLSILSKMPELTLFFMFYAQPQDVLQMAASQELERRGWTFDPHQGTWSIEDHGGLRVFSLHSWTIKARS